jgi:hypothetical protein
MLRHHATQSPNPPPASKLTLTQILTPPAPRLQPKKIFHSGFYREESYYKASLDRVYKMNRARHVLEQKDINFEGYEFAQVTSRGFILRSLYTPEYRVFVWIVTHPISRNLIHAYIFGRDDHPDLCWTYTSAVGLNNVLQRTRDIGYLGATDPELLKKTMEAEHTRVRKQMFETLFSPM